MDNSIVENACPCALCKNHITNTFTCKAFSEEIPDEILMGENNHKKSYPGDNGIQFEPKPEINKTDWNITFDFAKADDDQRIVFGWLSVVADESGKVLTDHQGDVLDEIELEKAVYDYVLQCRTAGEMHERIGVGKIVESCMFTREKMKHMKIPDETLPVGWWVGYKIDDDKTWAKIKSGEYSMFSIGGRGERVPIDELDLQKHLPGKHDQSSHGRKGVESAKMTKEEIKEAINQGKYEHYGIRVDEKTYSVGDELPKSRVWNDGDPTDELLNGTSVIIIETIEPKPGKISLDKALEESKKYFGENVYLVGGNKMEWGEDYGEAIIGEAVIMGKI